MDFTTPVHLPTVTIPKADHDSLVSIRRVLKTRELILISSLVVYCSPVLYASPDSVSSIYGALNSIDTDSNPANLRRNLYRGGIAEETLAVRVSKFPLLTLYLLLLIIGFSGLD